MEWWNGGVVVWFFGREVVCFEVLGSWCGDVRCGDARCGDVMYGGGPAW